MSFTTEIKNEIAILKQTKTESISELSGFIRNNKIDINNLMFSSENPKVARCIYSLLKDIFDISPIIEQKKSNSFNKKYFYNVKIFEKQKFILEDLCYIDSNGKYLKVPKDYLIDSEELKRAYLRGVFLARGSINDPKTSRYHLEYLIEEKPEAEFIYSLLENFSLNSKIILRDNGFMVYIKEAEKIADFLRIISANKAVLYYEDIRIYRDHKNMTNRLNNCEQANVDKIIDASKRQIEEMNYLIEVVGLDNLDLKLQETIIYRRKYPEVSLNELCYIINTETNSNLTKSGLNHRLRKIKNMVQKIKDN